MRVLASAICAVALLGGASVAQAATVLTFDELAQAGTGFDNYGPAVVDYEGFRFQSTYQESPHFLFWRQDDARNADQGGGTLAHRWDSYPMTISRTDGKAFDLISFDVADLFNAGSAFFNQIQFRYADGRSENLNFTTDTQVGLQTLMLNRNNLMSVEIAAGSRQWWQIDNFTVGDGVAAVPEPATWAMMLLGFFGLGSTIRARRSALARV